MKVITDEQKIDELLGRGIENIFPNREFLKSKMLKGEQVTFYLGIDPTGPTLHMGHAIPLMKLGVFQKLGHKIIMLIGDFTATIGDPTDKTAVRKKLTREEILANCEKYKEQASKFISFSGENAAELKYNSEWLAKKNFEDVLELTSLMTVEQMLKRDMFAKRIEENKPIYIHEFLYPLMQGIDSVEMDVDGEIGGNDQTFNMLVGRDLLKTLKNKEKFVVATKLLVDNSGKKMGKTEGNMITFQDSPSDMFGKVMSWNDSLIAKGFELCTDVSFEDIKDIEEKMSTGENPKDFKMKLAFAIVTSYYNETDAQSAQDSFVNTFQKGEIPEEMTELSISDDEILIDILVKGKVVSSKSEYRRLLEEGAITNLANDEKVTDVSFKPEKGMSFRIGKKRFVKIL